MSHFRLNYLGFDLDLPLEAPAIFLYATMGRWPGQMPDDRIDLNIEAKSPKFFFNPHSIPEDEDDDYANWLNPFVGTQWLELPTKLFRSRTIADLDGIQIYYGGDGTLYPLIEDDWREPPGNICTYSNEFFRKADINLTQVGGNFEAHLVGETENDTHFDILLRAPLTIQLNGHRGHTEAELKAWLDTFLDTSAFAFTAKTHGEDVYLKGAAKI